MRGRRTLALGAVVGLATIVGCSEESQLERTGPAQRFRLTYAPEGYELAVAGRGNTEPWWGADCCGSDEPILVLGEPDRDDPTDGRLIVVSATGYAEYQGGFAQTSSAYSGAGRQSEKLVVAGRDAIYTPSAARSLHGPPNDEVVVDHGPTVRRDDKSGERTRAIAIRVTGPGADRDDLLAVASRTSLVPGPDQTARPVVADPPEGLVVLSQASVDLAVAVAGPTVPEPQQDRVPGTRHSFAVAHGRGRANGVLAVWLSGSPADLLAARFLAPALYREAVTVEVEGRPGVLLRGDEGRTALVVAPAVGGLLVVKGDATVSQADFERVAAGAEPIDEAAWERQLIEARGGPGLRPDRGAVELARGEADGTGWLLQAVAPSQEHANDYAGGPRAGHRYVVDSCLRLADGRHACADHTIGTSDFLVHFHRGANTDPVPQFVSGTVPPEVVRVRVEARGGTVEVETVPIPEREERAFVTVVDGLIERRDSVQFLAADGTAIYHDSAP